MKPTLTSFEQLRLDAQARIRGILESPTNHKREALTPLLAGSDALAYAQRRAEDYTTRARSELACLPPSSCRAILETLTDRVVHRST